ncbi:MAG: FmdB family zinc ribbon protein [Aeromicrobium sp.]|uniref:FmdB family zinc ribbon protein n=1 Tax=Aeromicrobium sp. TaxID=1871063 RepID=UPI003C63A3D7
MPTYQYQCTDCGEALEIHQSFSDDALTQCPSCRGTLRKVFNAVGVVFKGSGFYRNDSRPTSSTDHAKKPASTPAASAPAATTAAATTSSSSSDS